MDTSGSCTLSSVAVSLHQRLCRRPAAPPSGVCTTEPLAVAGGSFPAREERVFGV